MSFQLDLVATTRRNWLRLNRIGRDEMIGCCSTEAENTGDEGWMSRELDHSRTIKVSLIVESMVASHCLEWTSRASSSGVDSTVDTRTADTSYPTSTGGHY